MERALAERQQPGPRHDLRLQDIPALSATFSGKLGAAASILQTAPVIVP